MKAYPKYKDSGIDWIGQIPAHWQVKRVKELGILGSGTTPKSGNDAYYDDGTNPWLNTGCVQNCIIAEPAKYVTDLALRECNGLKFFPKNTILIAMYGGGTIGNVGLMSFDATINQACCAIELQSQHNPKYFFYALMAQNSKLVSLGFGGTQINLSQGQIANFILAVPPIDEQRAIADYLDEKCGEIDGQVELLEKKRKAYERLKASIINNAVTRGLNPDVPLRDSGIDWIGEIPAHWSVRRFKEMFSSYTTGITPESKNDKFFEVDDGHTWITIADMNSKFVSSSNLNLSQTAVDLFQPPITKRGSLMFSFKLSIGKICFAQKDLYTNEAIVSIPPQDDFDMNFIYYLLPKILRLNATENIYGAKMLNQKIIANMRIMFPPIDEQRAITTYLDEKCGEIDANIENIGKQIDAYKRLKRALINEVVTGRRAV